MPSGDAMFSTTFSATRKLLAAAVAAGALLAILGVPAAWAAPAEQLGLRWDGPTTNIDWRGHGYASADGSFIGEVVAVPGDQASRTAIVRNDGPGPARATVEITAVTRNHADTVNTELAELIKLRWDVDGRSGASTWKDAPATGPVYSATFPVSQGGEFPITVGYLFPYEAVGGKNAGHASSELLFAVHVALEGDTTPPVGPKPNTGGGIAPAAGPALAAAAALVLAALLAARRARTVPQRKELR